MQYYFVFNTWMNNSPSTLSPLRFDRLSDRVSPASENIRSDDVLAASTASRCWATHKTGVATWQPYSASRKWETSDHSDGRLEYHWTSIRISHSQSQVHNSQALSALFIIFWLRYHGNTILNTTVPAVLPQSLSPLLVITAAVASITAVNPRLPRYYRCPHYRAGL